MPRKASVTREQILDTATQLVRDSGHEALTARSLAARLGCSTQPILYCFLSMDDLVQTLYQHVDALHTQALMAGLDKAVSPMLQIGLNYVRFAQDEPALFRFLFQSNGLGEQNMTQLIESSELTPLIDVLCAEAKILPAQARQIFLTLFACAHGLASMLANNALVLDEQSAIDVLNAAFVGAMASVNGELNDEYAG